MSIQMMKAGYDMRHVSEQLKLIAPFASETILSMANLKSTTKR